MNTLEMLIYAQARKGARCEADCVLFYGVLINVLKQALRLRLPCLQKGVQSVAYVLCDSWVFCPNHKLLMSPIHKPGSSYAPIMY